MASSIEDRIRKLLNLADNATQEEQDAAIRKAATLAAEHSIDLEEVRKRRIAQGKPAEEPQHFPEYYISGTYRKFRAMLASRIGGAMDCVMRIANDGSYVTYIGFADDVRLAQLTYEFVVEQMMASADRAVKECRHLEIADWSTASGRMSAQTYKANFFRGFVDRVQSRIRLARQKAAEAVVYSEGGVPFEREVVKDGRRSIESGVTERVTGVLALRERHDVVKGLNEKLYGPPRIDKSGRQVYWQAPKARTVSSKAYKSGDTAGRRAVINPGHQVGKSARRALGA